MENRLLKLPEVRARVPLSKASIYLKISRGEFPRPVPLGARSVAWKSSDVDAWVSSQEQAGKAKAAVVGK